MAKPLTTGAAAGGGAVQMELPFTTEQFLGVFESYNVAVWPAQWCLYALGLTALWLAARPARGSNRIVNLIVSLLWLWSGAIYHLLFFTAVNAAAYAFGVLFIAEGVIIFRAGVWKGELDYRPRADWRGAAGALLVAYALLLYPAVGHLLGHRYPAAPTFGLPCPTTIFTLAMLSWSKRRVPYRLLLIPLFWTAAGVVAALQWGMYEDFALLAAAALGVSIPSRRRGRVAAHAEATRGASSASAWNVRGLFDGSRWK